MKWLRIQKYRQKRKTMRQRGWSKRRNCHWKCFYSFNYVIDNASICFFCIVNSLHYFLQFLLYYLLHFSSSDCFAALTLIWIYEFFKYPQKRVFHNVTLSNLENVLQRNLRTDRATDCIFWVFGGRNFEISPLVTNLGCVFVDSMCVLVCPKKLWIQHC